MALAASSRADLVHPGMRDEVFTDLPVGGQDTDHASGNACLDEQLGQYLSIGRRLRRQLQCYTVT